MKTINVTITLKRCKKGYQVRCLEMGNYTNFENYNLAIDFAERWINDFKKNEKYNYITTLIINKS